MNDRDRRMEMPTDDQVDLAVEAFTAAAEDEPRSRGIQVGFYELREDAFDRVEQRGAGGARRRAPS